MNYIEQIWPEWHVEELIGQGSYGKVYKAARMEAGFVSRAAIKVIRIPTNDSEITELSSMGMSNLSIKSYFEQTSQEVMREIALMEELKGCKNIVSVEDFKRVERSDGVGWVICIRMELLNKLTDRYGIGIKPTASEVVTMGIQLCRALEQCHEKGVLHRDVKPENVFWCEASGEYKLGDFGIAKRLESRTQSAHTRVGTLNYMAPEVARGNSYGANADVYSLGLMLYRYLNDMRFPFLPAAPAPVLPQDAEQAGARRLRGDKIPAPANADTKLASIILKACDPDPNTRYASAAAFRRDLEGWGQSGGTAPRSYENYFARANDADTKIEAYKEQLSRIVNETDPSDALAVSEALRQLAEMRDDVNHLMGSIEELDKQINLSQDGISAKSRKELKHRVSDLDMSADGLLKNCDEAQEWFERCRASIGSADGNDQRPAFAGRIKANANLITIALSLIAILLGIAVILVYSPLQFRQDPVQESTGSNDGAVDVGADAGTQANNTGQPSGEDPESDEVVEAVVPREDPSTYSWSELAEIATGLNAVRSKALFLAVCRAYGLVDDEGALNRVEKEIKLSDGILLHCLLVDVKRNDAAAGNNLFPTGLTFMCWGSQLRHRFDSNNGVTWTESELRSWLNEEVVAMLPEDLSQNIVLSCVHGGSAPCEGALATQKGKNLDYDYHGPDDYLWAPSARELGGKVDFEWSADPDNKARYDALLNDEREQFTFYSGEAGAWFDQAGKRLVDCDAESNREIAFGDCFWLRSYAQSTGRPLVVDKQGCIGIGADAWDEYNVVFCFNLGDSVNSSGTVVSKHYPDSNIAAE